MRFIVPIISKPLPNNQYHIMELKYGTLFQMHIQNIQCKDLGDIYEKAKTSSYQEKIN